MNWKQWIPPAVRLLYRLLQRRRDDQKSRFTAQLTRQQRSPENAFPFGIETVQPINVSAFFENKIHNIALASAAVRRVVIPPGAVFSFWAVVGYPGRHRGYRLGRNLVNGQVRGAYGGGLCQVSGLMYYLALQAGLEVLERHNHSVDIYTEAERFAPLGSDATVVFGYKDLRFRNNLNTAVCFELEVCGTHLHGRLCATGPLSPQTPEFIREEHPGQRHVRTEIAGNLVARSVYLVRTP
jgi:vancomycin resistance protein VanW